MQNVGISLMFAICCLGVFYIVLDIIFGQASREKRIINKRLASLTSEGNVEIEKKGYFSDIKKLNELFSKQALMIKLNQSIEMSGLRISTSLFLFTCLFASVAIGLVFVSYGFERLPSMGLSFAFIFLSAFLYLRIARIRYIAAFTKNFPKAIQVMKGALGAGLGLQSSIERAALDSPYPVNVEFTHVIRELQLGKNFGEAISSLSKRIGTADMITFAVGVTVQQQAGGNLVELMRNLEETINARVLMRKELNSLTAQAKLSGIIIGFLPFILTAAIKIINPSYIDILFTSSSGQQLLGMTLFLQFVGFIVIKKMTNVRIIA